MNSFKRSNNHLTHAQIVNEYERKIKELERHNERLNSDNDVLGSKVENTKYFIKSRIYYLKKSLEKEPDKINQAQLELCRYIWEELK